MAFWLGRQKTPQTPKEFGDEELEVLLIENCCQTQEERAGSLGIAYEIISKHLKADFTCKSRCHMN